MRCLYQLLVRLHPPSFRREFAGEMLWIFDESRASQGTGPLFYDGLVSLARQWVVRSGSWKVPVALLGALLQVTLGGLGWAAMEHPRIAAQTARAQFEGAWVGEVNAPQGSRKIELQLAPRGRAWGGKVLWDGRELAVRDVRVGLGSVRFGLQVGESTLWFQGKRSVRGGQMFGVVQGFEKGSFHLVRE